MKLNGNIPPPAHNQPNDALNELAMLTKIVADSNKTNDERMKVLHHALSVVEQIIANIDIKGARA